MKRLTIYITLNSFVSFLQCVCAYVCVCGVFSDPLLCLPVCPANTRTIKIRVPFTAVDCSVMQMSDVTAALFFHFLLLYYIVSDISALHYG